MSREFSLVLLGAGVLTTGYFASASVDEQLEAKAEQQAATRTGHTHYRPGGFFFFIHSPMYSGTPTGRPVAYSPTTRSGGFGAAGRAFSGGGS
jgi:hypothetical protein